MNTGIFSYSGHRAATIELKQAGRTSVSRGLRESSFHAVRSALVDLGVSSVEHVERQHVAARGIRLDRYLGQADSPVRIAFWVEVRGDRSTETVLLTAEQACHFATAMQHDIQRELEVLVGSAAEQAWRDAGQEDA